LEGAIKKEFGDLISEVELIPSDGGAYEIRVDDELIYSKLETGRHADPPEILDLFKEHIRE
jgi:selenoprotein W-related protein